MGGERVHFGDENGGGELLFVEGFVEIEDGEGESRPGGMFGGVEGGIVWGVAGGEEFSGVFGVSGELVDRAGEAREEDERFGGFG